MKRTGHSVGGTDRSPIAPGAPLERVNGLGPWRRKVVVGQLVAGAGVLRCVHYYNQDENGVALAGAQQVTLRDDALNDVLFAATLNPGESSPPLFIPFGDGISSRSLAKGLVICGD